jgi:hypothetical protein
LNILCPTCGIDIDEHETNNCLDVWISKNVMSIEGGLQLKNYSSNKEYMHEVLDMMKHKGWNWVLCDDPCAEFWRDEDRTGCHNCGEDYSYRSFADTLSLAIGRAAIKAVYGNIRIVHYKGAENVLEKNKTSDIY